MITTFTDHQKAREHAVEIHNLNAVCKREIGLCIDSNSLWHKNEQILLFPVVTIKYITAIECYDLFINCLNFNSEIIVEIRTFLLLLLDKNYDIRIISMTEWLMELQIIENSCIDLTLANKFAKSLNEKINFLMRAEYGKMNMISSQPSGFYKNMKIFKIGVR